MKIGTESLQVDVRRGAGLYRALLGEDVSEGVAELLQLHRRGLDAAAFTADPYPAVVAQGLEAAFRLPPTGRCPSCRAIRRARAAARAPARSTIGSRRPSGPTPPRDHDGRVGTIPNRPRDPLAEVERGRWRRMRTAALPPRCPDWRIRGQARHRCCRSPALPAPPPALRPRAQAGAPPPPAPMRSGGLRADTSTNNVRGAIAPITAALLPVPSGSAVYQSLPT